MVEIIVSFLFITYENWLKFPHYSFQSFALKNRLSTRANELLYFTGQMMSTLLLHNFTEMRTAEDDVWVACEKDIQERIFLAAIWSEVKNKRGSMQRQLFFSRWN